MLFITPIRFVNKMIKVAKKDNNVQDMNLCADILLHDQEIADKFRTDLMKKFA